MKNRNKPKYKQPPLVSIIIPVMGRFDLLTRCLDAIPEASKNIQFETILVDNNSPKEEADKFYSEREDFILIRNKENLGFPKACNQGARRSNAPLLFFLNSDVILYKDAIDHLVRDMDDPKLGIAGMLLLFPEYAEGLDQRVRPSGKVQHVGMDTNIHGRWIHTFVGWDADNPKVLAQRNCYAVTGAALMTRRKLYMDNGGFNEAYGIGCLVGDTLVNTDSGILKLSDLILDEDKDKKCFLRELKDIKVDSEHNIREANMSFVNGKYETLKVVLEKRFEIQGTPNHRIRVMSNNGEVIWKSLEELKIGDFVAVKYGSNLFGKNCLSSDDAYLMGLYIAEGSYEKTGRITITTSDDQIIDFLCSKDFIKNQEFHYRKGGKEFIKWLSNYVDLSKKALNKEIPSFFLKADKETQIEFLRGLFDGDGCAIKDGRVTYSSSSLLLIKQLQIMLLNFGMVVGYSSRIGKSNRVNYLIDFGRYSKNFYSEMGFKLQRKQERNAFVRKSKSTNIPYQRQWFKELYSDFSIGNRENKIFGMHNSNPSEGVSRETIELIVKKSIERGKNYLDKSIGHFGEILAYKCEWLKVVSIEDGGIQPTYDLHVPSNHAYVANGLIVHNTYEDVDYCMTIRELGYNIIVDTNAVGTHFTGATAEFYRIGYPMDYNRLVFLQKWSSKIRWSEYERW